MEFTRIGLLMVCALGIAGASCGDDEVVGQSGPLGDATRDDADGGADEADSAGRASQPARAGAAAPANSGGAGGSAGSGGRAAMGGASATAGMPSASKPAGATPPVTAGSAAGVPPQPSAASGSMSTPSAAGAPAGSQPVLSTAPKPGEVETVAMDLVYTSDLAGNVLQDPRPIILFKDGWATKDINYFVRGLDIPAHKMMYPKTWVEWQLVDDQVALKSSNGSFTKMYFQNRYEPNSSSLTFEQKFTRLLTGVNVALGTSAVVQKDIQFWNDHRVVVGSYTAVLTPGTVSQVVPPESRGTYHIDGYTIELAWDDGTTKKTSFVWSEEDPEAVYIDGLAYIVFN